MIWNWCEALGKEKKKLEEVEEIELIVRNRA